MGINDFFTEESLNAAGGIAMLDHAVEDKKTLYLTNANGQKLLKIVVKNEACAESGGEYAQIKIVPYGIKRALVWRDLPSDPLHPILHDGVTLTYHGGKRVGQKAKVHVKATAGYRTLIDDSLELPTDLVVPVPVFSLETGFASQRALTDPVTKKKCHCLAAQAGRYAHARQFKRMKKAVRTLKTRVGRVHREIERKIEAIPVGEQNEFGVKVSIATTLKENVVVGMRSMPGNPYDGITRPRPLNRSASWPTAHPRR